MTSASGPRWRRWRLAAATVRGRSMQPTLYDGDRLLVLRGARLRLGDVAVVRFAEGDVVAVKRVVHHDDDGWWVERDNPREGVDSWTVGTVAEEQVVGRVLCRVWPLVRRR